MEMRIDLLAMMLNNVNNLELKGRVANYTCNLCGVETGALLLDDGIVPKVMQCPFCGKGDSCRTEKVVWDVCALFYRPDVETFKTRLSDHQRGHVLGGGLMLKHMAEGFDTEVICDFFAMPQHIVEAKIKSHYGVADIGQIKASNQVSDQSMGTNLSTQSLKRPDSGNIPLLGYPT